MIYPTSYYKIIFKIKNERVAFASRSTPLKRTNDKKMEFSCDCIRYLPGIVNINEIFYNNDLSCQLIDGMANKDCNIICNIKNVKCTGETEYGEPQGTFNTKKFNFIGELEG